MAQTFERFKMYMYDEENKVRKLLDFFILYLCYSSNIDHRLAKGHNFFCRRDKFQMRKLSTLNLFTLPNQCWK